MYRKESIFTMNKQMKVLLIITVLIASTVTVVYAPKPEEPNLADLVQSILDYLEYVVNPQIAVHDTDIKARLDTQDTALSDLDTDLADHHTAIGLAIDAHELARSTALTTHESNILTALTTVVGGHDDDVHWALADQDTAISNLQTDVDALTARVSGIPVMEVESGISLESTPDTVAVVHGVYSSGMYPNGAIFNVVVSGGVTGTGGSVYVDTKIPYELGGTDYIRTVTLHEKITSPSDDPLVLEFPGKYCIIHAYVPAGETYSVTYYVTITYVPDT
jgi:hypothetical protein